MSRQSVQRVADLLADDGILSLDANPDHARSPLLRLTPKGESVEAHLTAIGGEWAVAIAEGLKGHDLEQAVDVVRAVIRKLDDPVSAPHV